MVGNVNVPVFTICDIIGFVKVFPVNVCTALKLTIVSVISGNVNVLFAVWAKFNVVKVLVAALTIVILSLFVTSILFMINVEMSDNDLPDNVSVVALPTNVSVVFGKVKVPVFII